MPARWFPRQRATAVGVSPRQPAGHRGGDGRWTRPCAVDVRRAGSSSSTASSQPRAPCCSCCCAREHPPTPAWPAGQEERALVLDGLRMPCASRVLVRPGDRLHRPRDLQRPDHLDRGDLRPRGFSSEDAGTLGAVMLVAGLVGAVVLPAHPTAAPPPAFPVLAFVGAIPGLLGVALAGRCPACWSRGRCSASSWSPRCRSGSSTRRGHPAHARGDVERAHAAVRPGLGGLRYLMRALRTPDGSFTRAMVAALALLVVGVVLAHGCPSRMSGQAGRAAARRQPVH